MNRTLILTIQSKGGAGKSFHTYFRALSELDGNSLFVDVDSSTQTSTRQLKFLGNERVETLSLLDKRDVLVRDAFLGYMESIAQCNFNKVYFDFGAAESQQLPALLRDIPMAEFCDELGFELIFNVVVGGGGAYKASTDYLKEILSVVNGEFKITVWENTISFDQFPKLSKELADNCIKLGLDHKKFGDFNPSSLICGQVMEGARKGYSLADYSPGARIRIKKELKENFSNE